MKTLYPMSISTPLSVALLASFFLFSCSRDNTTGPANSGSDTPSSGDTASTAGNPTSTGTKPDFSLLGYATQNGGTNGGEGGQTVTANTLAEFTTYATSDASLIIQVPGTISGGTEGASIQVNSNKTITGLDDKGFLEGVGLTINGRKNIIIRNIRFTMSNVTKTYINSENRPQVVANDGDCITIQGSSSKPTTNIWIDHCEFFNKDPHTQTNQDLYDGLVDAKGVSDYITISWCYFHDHHKCHLIGSSDSDNYDRKITFHHNYYYNLKERLPSYRFGSGHVFNNYYNAAISSAVNSRMGACVKVERNSFENSNDPILSKNSDQPGNWMTIDNLFSNCTGNQPVNTSCTLTIPYKYTADNQNKVKATVTTWAGVGKL